MTHAPMNARPWKEEMLAGTVDPERGQQAGEVLGTMHEFSASHPERFEAFADSKVFYELRVEPFYERVADRCPDAADVCKHVAASLYGVGTRLDARPELLFELRGVDPQDLIQQAAEGLATAGDGAPTALAPDTDDLGALFGIDLVANEPPPTRSRSSPATAKPARKRAAKR